MAFAAYRPADGGCTATAVHSDGISSSVAWHATEVQLTNARVQGRPGECFAFTLARQENEAVPH
jgi:predicted CxxxxCH...CXXCH cytochrome family protein